MSTVSCGPGALNMALSILEQNTYFNGLNNPTDFITEN